MSETSAQPVALDIASLIDLDGLQALYDSPAYVAQELDRLRDLPQTAILIYQELACQDDKELRCLAARRLADVIDLDVDAGLELGSYLVTDEDPAVARAASQALNQAFIDNQDTPKFSAAQILHAGRVIRYYEKRCASSKPDPYKYCSYL